MRLEVTAGAELRPHAALQPDPKSPGAYLFDPARLGEVSDWLQQQRADGAILDFRIGPPSLDDIYTVTVAGTNGRELAAEGAR